MCACKCKFKLQQHHQILIDSKCRKYKTAFKKFQPVPCIVLSEAAVRQGDRDVWKRGWHVRCKEGCCLKNFEWDSFDASLPNCSTTSSTKCADRGHYVNKGSWYMYMLGSLLPLIHKTFTSVSLLCTCWSVKQILSNCRNGSLEMEVKFNSKPQSNTCSTLVTRQIVTTCTYSCCAID